MKRKSRAILFLIGCFCLTYTLDQGVMYFLRCHHVVNIVRHQILHFGLWVFLCAVVAYLLGPLFKSK